ncbi:MAG: hypothetical protein ACKO13_00865, partial [Cytophagales bacterium]
MAYTKEVEAPTLCIAVNVIDSFKNIVGKEFVMVDEETRNDYGHDKTEDYQFLPDVVIKPGTPEEVSAILKICNQYK